MVMYNIKYFKKIYVLKKIIHIFAFMKVICIDNKINKILK